MYVVLLRSDSRLDTSLVYAQRPSTQPKVCFIAIQTHPYSIVTRPAVAEMMLAYHTSITLVSVIFIISVTLLYCVY